MTMIIIELHVSSLPRIAGSDPTFLVRTMPLTDIVAAVSSLILVRRSVYKINVPRPSLVHVVVSGLSSIVRSLTFIMFSFYKFK